MHPRYEGTRHGPYQLHHNTEDLHETAGPDRDQTGRDESCNSAETEKLWGMGIRRGESRGSYIQWTDLIGTYAVTQGTLSTNITSPLNQGDVIVLLIRRSFGAARIYYTISSGNIQLIRR